MPKPFRRIDVAAFAELVGLFDFKRKITSFHVHHTFIPRRSQFKGLASIEAMDRDHRLNRHFADIAQHITLDPNGFIWTGRSWNAPPASATGFNGNAKAGPFMMEMIGDFDKGEEPFDGAQATNAYQIVAIILKHFGLGTEAIRFHNEMSSKTCPGSSISKPAFVKQVQAALNALPAPPAAAANPILRDAVSGLLAPMETASVIRGEGTGELDEEEETYLQYVGRTAAEAGEEAASRAASGPTLTQLTDLVPHVVNLRRGKFSEDDLFVSNEGTVDAIFAGLEAKLNDPNEPKPLKLMFWAHGGLNDEKGSLLKAHRDLWWWKQNGVYPIFFIWHTDLGSAIGDLIHRSREGERGLGEIISDVTDSAIEHFVHAVGGIAVWDSMKFSAAEASAADGGANYVGTKLHALITAHPGRVEVHTIGHSAGPIFHSHFIRAANVQVKSLQMLAPAIRIDEYKSRIDGLLGGLIEKAKIYTMRDGLERADNCAQVYRKSLLYLISRGLEIHRDEPILGLERFLTKDAITKVRFGISGPSAVGEVIFTKSDRSGATAHGAFDDDVLTMDNAAATVLGHAPDVSYERAATGTTAVDVFSRALPLPPQVLVAAPPRRTIGAPALLVQRASAGRRRAICVGINTYPTAPLHGCVSDAELWAKTLASMGFEPPKLLLDSVATRQAIIDTLSSTLKASVPGDVVVFQYSGHGTEVPDLNGDELSTNDQALCPYDFADGHLLIDDDIADLFKQIPDGVDVTCFLDNCFSGTATRFAIGRTNTVSGGASLSRFVVADDELLRKHEAFRRTIGILPARAVARGPASMREVVFSACRSDEVAFEQNGQGDFTRNAVALLKSVSSPSNQDFQQQLVANFSPAGRQHPTLDCAPAANSAPLFSFGIAAAPSQPAPPTHAKWDAHGLSSELRSIADVIEQHN